MDEIEPNYALYALLAVGGLIVAAIFLAIGLWQAKRNRERLSKQRPGELDQERAEESEAQANPC